MREFMTLWGEMSENWYVCHGLGFVQSQAKLAKYTCGYIHGRSN